VSFKRTLHLIIFPLLKTTFSGT